jgi:hypothetical protein
MSLRKSIMIACLIGLGISGAGAGLVALGGWGPCGPGSIVATVGGCLNMAHVAWLLMLFPGLDALAGRHHADWVLVLVWPAVVWSALTFIALTFWKWLKKDEHQLP